VNAEAGPRFPTVFFRLGKKSKTSGRRLF